MKKLIAEFKKFITRGNVVDMAVGVIVGSSFTAIVNALSNQVLKPIINWLLALIFGKDSLKDLYTFLKRVEVPGVDGAEPTVDLAQSIYIDWGTLINAIINFFLVAIVLFAIVKIVNRAREEQKKLLSNMHDGEPTREEKKEMKKLGIKFSDKAAVAAYYAEKAKRAEEEKKAAEEKAKADRLANPTVEDLLKEIRDMMRADAEGAKEEQN